MTNKKPNIQRLFAVILVLISFIGLIICKSTDGGGIMVWSLLFFTGLVWFVGIRILKD